MSDLSEKQREIIQDLWGMGLTVVRRETCHEAFEAPKPPKGMAYQWMPQVVAKGWSPVTHDQHPGLFAPYGTTGEIEHQGMWLMERPKAEVEAALAASQQKAQTNIEDWCKRSAAEGITGAFTVVTDGDGGREIKTTEIGGGVATELRTKIPSDMVGHIREILTERDRMVGAVLSTSIEVPPEFRDAHLTSLKASCLQIAIDFIRNKYAERNDNGTTAQGH